MTDRPQTTPARARAERNEIAGRKKDLCNELHRIDERMADLEVFLKVAYEMENQHVQS
jgi:hypothetical protein